MGLQMFAIPHPVYLVLEIKPGHCVFYKGSQTTRLHLQSPICTVIKWMKTLSYRLSCAPPTPIPFMCSSPKLGIWDCDFLAGSFWKVMKLKRHNGGRLSLNLTVIFIKRGNVSIHRDVWHPGVCEKKAKVVKERSPPFRIVGRKRPKLKPSSHGILLQRLRHWLQSPCIDPYLSLHKCYI